jgi:hypothetical protein
MAFARFSFDFNVPSVGSRPPLLRAGFDVRFNALHLVLGGLVAAVIVWVAVGTPVPPALLGTSDEAESETPPSTSRLTSV